MANSGNGLGSLSAAQPDSLLGDLKTIWTKSGMLASCVSIPVVGVNAFVNNLIDPYRQLAEIFVLTAPLCCSIAIIAMLFMRGSFKGQSDLHAVYSVCAAFIGPYIVALFFGATTADIDKKFVSVDHWTGYLPHILVVKFAIGILFYYFSTYGLARTMSSAICGCFIAWVFQYKLLPRIRQKLEL